MIPSKYSLAFNIHLIQPPTKTHFPYTYKHSPSPNGKKERIIMPFTLSTPLQMCLIYHLNPYPRAARPYHSHLDVIRQRKVLLNTKCCECDDFIAECERYLGSKCRKKARLEAEQTSVVVGSPRAKQIGLELKIGDRCICKVKKQLDGAKKIKREGEDYSTYINLFH